MNFCICCCHFQHEKMSAIRKRGRLRSHLDEIPWMAHCHTDTQCPVYRAAKMVAPCQLLSTNQTHLQNLRLYSWICFDYLPIIPFTLYEGTHPKGDIETLSLNFFDESHYICSPSEYILYIAAMPDVYYGYVVSFILFEGRELTFPCWGSWRFQKT